MSGSRATAPGRRVRGLDHHMAARVDEPLLLLAATPQSTTTTRSSRALMALITASVKASHPWPACELCSPRRTVSEGVQQERALTRPAGQVT